MVNANDGGGGGGGGTPLIEGYESHDPRGGHFQGQGSSITKVAGDVENFNADLTTSHNTATTGVSGVLADAMEGADAPTKAAGRDLIQKIISGGGAIRWYGDGVDEYNTTISGLNQQIFAEETKAKQQEKKAALNGQYRNAVDALETRATSTKTKLSNPLDPATIKSLYLAGALPMSLDSLFPTVKLTAEERLRSVQARIKSGELPDFGAMTEDEVDAYLKDNPELGLLVPSLMQAQHPDPATEALINAQARLDADTTKDGIDDEAGQGALDKIEAGQKTLAQINDKLAEGGRLTAAEAAYMAAWMNRVGAQNLTKLPQIVTDSVYKTQHPPSVQPRDVNKYLSPVSNAILNYSNPAKHLPGAVDVTGGMKSPGEGGAPNGQVDLDEMPQAIQDLVNMRVGETDEERQPWSEAFRVGDTKGDGVGSFATIKNLDAFNGWAELLGTSTVDGGEDFSVDLGRQALQTKQDMTSMISAAGVFRNGSMAEFYGVEGDEAYEDLKERLHDTGVSNLLSVTARNEDAASDMLFSEDDRKALLGMDWGHDSGAVDVINAGTDRDPEGGGGGEKQTRGALELFKDVSGDRAGYLGGRYDSDGDGDIDKDDEVAPARMSEGISDAVVDAGIRWVDQFGQATDTNTQNGVSEDGKGFTLDHDTQNGLFRFVAGTGDGDDDLDPVRFHTAASLDAQNDVTRALNGEGDLDTALRRAGRLEGAINGADVQFQIEEAGGKDADENAQKEAAFESKERAWTAGKFASGLVVAGVGAATGPAAPVTTALLSAGVGSIMGELGPGDPPDYASIYANKTAADVLSDMELNAPTGEQRVLINSSLQNGDLDSIPDEYLETGSDGVPQLKADVPATVLEEYYDDLKNKHDIDEGTYKGAWDTEFHARDTLPTTKGHWTTDETLLESQYGDNWVHWNSYGDRDDYDDYSPFPKDPSKIDD